MTHRSSVAALREPILGLHGRCGDFGVAPASAVQRPADLESAALGSHTAARMNWEWGHLLRALPATCPAAPDSVSALRDSSSAPC
jgi:hypothetical protein